MHYKKDTMKKLFFIALCFVNFIYSGNQEDLERFEEYGKCDYCDLQGFDLTQIINNLRTEKHCKVISLVRAKLNKANLSEADLSDAKLTGAELVNANLENANLRKADATRANFTEANFKNATMRNMHLAFAIVYKAQNLTDEQLNSAFIYGLQGPCCH